MEDPITEDERKEMMGHLKTVSNSLDETLHNLYEVISIQNNINLVFVPLNLNEYITKAIGVLNEQVTQKGAIINNYTKADATVRYNPAYLESILLNFISNAVKYSHPERKPVITIDCFYENNKPVLTIADNGVGIDLKRFGDKLFGMYKTFHGNADARGIGLFISKNQIDFMGGKVEVESQLNIGSTFKIYF
jgi:signal transduction histidine kinase